MLISVQALAEELVAGQDHDDGKVLVDKSQHTVLQLTAHDGLAMEITNLLNLEGALESCAVLAATTEEQKRLLVPEPLLAHLLDLLVLGKDGRDLLADLTKTLHDLLATLFLGSAILTKGQSEHDHGDELRGIGLGGGNTDLRASVDMHTAVGHHGDGRTDNVDNTNGEGSPLQAVPERHKRISSLTRLRHEDAGVVTEDGGFTVEEIGRELDRNGDLGQFLKNTTNRHTAVVRGTASNEDNATAATDGVDVAAKTTESNGLVGNVKTTTHGVDDGLGLLENLLLHEVVELALHNLLKLELKRLDCTNVGTTIGLFQTVNVERALVDVGDIVILEVHDLLGVLDDGGRVR